MKSDNRLSFICDISYFLSVKSDRGRIATVLIFALLAEIIPDRESSNAMHFDGSTFNFFAVAKYTAGWGFPSISCSEEDML